MFKIITLPFDRKIKGFDDETLNKSILNKKVKSHKAEFFQDGDDNYWTILIEYDPVLEKSPKKDFEKLDETQKILFEKFRIWRKEKADKEGVPVYIVGTNKELSDMVKNAPKSLEALKNIKGFGKSKISKYGNELIEIIKAFYEKS